MLMITGGLVCARLGPYARYARSACACEFESKNNKRQQVSEQKVEFIVHDRFTELSSNPKKQVRYGHLATLCAKYEDRYDTDPASRRRKTICDGADRIVDW